MNPGQSRSDNGNGHMIARAKIIPALAQDGGRTGAAGVAKKFHIVPVIIFRNLRTLADCLQHAHIGLMTDKDKAIAIQGVGLLQHANGLCCLSNGKALHGVPVLLEVTHAGYPHFVPA
jgi:hypothetical protein